MVTQPSWSTYITDMVAAEVRRYRRERGLSAQQLSERCADLGMEISRATVADLENGRRAAISIAELMVLAAALGVPPILLVLPVGRQENVELLPDRATPTWAAALWFSGQGDIHVTPASLEVHWNDGGAVVLMLEYVRLIYDLQEDRKAIGRTVTNKDLELWRGMTRQIRAVRRQLLRLGLEPPSLSPGSLPPGLPGLDEAERHLTDLETE